MRSLRKSAPDTSRLPQDVILNDILGFVEESEKTSFCVDRFCAQHISALRSESLNESLKRVSAELHALGFSPSNYVQEANCHDLGSLYIRLIISSFREVTSKVHQLENNQNLENEVKRILERINALENFVKCAPASALHAIEKIFSTLSSVKLFPSGIRDHCMHNLRERLIDFGKDWLLESQR